MLGCTPRQVVGLEDVSRPKTYELTDTCLMNTYIILVLSNLLFAANMSAERLGEVRVLLVLALTVLYRVSFSGVAGCS